MISEIVAVNDLYIYLNKIHLVFTSRERGNKLSWNNDSVDECVKEIVTSNSIKLFLGKFLSEDLTKRTSIFNTQYRISDIMYTSAIHLDIK